MAVPSSSFLIPHNIFELDASGNCTFGMHFCPHNLSSVLQ